MVGASSMKIRIEEGLPFVTVILVFQEQQIQLDQVILDTGSAGTIFKLGKLKSFGIRQEVTDAVHRISGVGGSEFVFMKRIDRIILGNIAVNDFEVEIGTMEYGFPIDGILGLDFLAVVGVVIDLKQLEIYV